MDGGEEEVDVLGIFFADYALNLYYFVALDLIINWATNILILLFV